MESDYAIIGGGVVGLSVAWGLLRRGLRVTVIDGDDAGLRASRGNFGLVWVQSKGMTQPRYAQWSQTSAALWRGFADELSDLTGTDLGLRQDGGYDLHFSEETLAETVAKYEVLKATLGGDYPYEVLGHNALRKEEPNIGHKVVGAIWHKQDGHANPLRLLQALADGVRRKGGRVLTGQKVVSVDKADGFTLTSADGTRIRAAQMVRAGVPPLALVETQTRGDVLRAARHLPRAMLGLGYLLKGLGLLRDLRRAGVARFTGATDIRVEGSDHAEAVTFTTRGQAHRIACDTALLHHGVVPNTQATRSLNLPHHWDNAQRSFRPVTDGWGRSAEPTVFVAGDGAGIKGARAATLTGQIAALAIAHDLGKLTEGDRDLSARPLRLRLALKSAARPFLDRAYPPCAQALAPEDATIICRCEEVTAGAIRRSAAQGCLDPNQTKAFVRAGMGPCQGRYCGSTVTEILSACHDQAQSQTGAYRIRPPIKPVTLGELAQMDTQGEEPLQEV
ncbi:FAD-dependent oxidoreductase [Roseovarius sp. MBR-6]|uniref:FAD-dependent oxidoreductase n=1 Tax=Roseovarius sp. MBR-6 TaxID=3156459 RepID=UPI00339ABA1E